MADQRTNKLTAKKKARDEFQEDEIFQAPVIQREPSSRQARIGSRVVLRVVATGKPLPSFQWFHNGKQISGANSDRLSLPKVRRQAMGAYHCEAKNFVGKAVSRAAMLSFFTQSVPQIVIGPVKSKITEGKPFTLSVTSPAAEALKDFKIYWTFNGKRIKGALGPALNISAVKKKYEGEYKAIIAAGSGIESSNVANLIVKAEKAAAASPEPTIETVELPPPAETVAPASSWADENFNPEEEELTAPAAGSDQTFPGTPVSRLGTQDLIREVAAHGGASELLAAAALEDPSSLIASAEAGGAAETPESGDPSSLLETLPSREEPREASRAMPAPSALPPRPNAALARKKEFLENLLQHWQRGRSAKRAA